MRRAAAAQALPISNRRRKKSYSEVEAGLQEVRIVMARVTLSYEECTALRRAAESIPVRRRSEHLVSALRVLGAVLAAVERGRSMLDRGGDPPTPEKSPS
jgi:hypothetical protein